MTLKGVREKDKKGTDVREVLKDQKGQFEMRCSLLKRLWKQIRGDLFESCGI